MSMRYTTACAAKHFECDTMADLLAAHDLAAVGDKATLLSSAIDLTFKSIGASNRWCPNDATWGGNTCVSVPIGAIDAKGVWTISEGLNNIPNASMNKVYDVLQIVMLATTTYNIVKSTATTARPAYIMFRCAELYRQDTANSVYIEPADGMGFAGGGAFQQEPGFGPSQYAYHGQFCVAAQGGSGGGGFNGAGGYGGPGPDCTTGDFYGTTPIASKAGGAINTIGVNGTSLTFGAAQSWELSHPGGNCALGAGGGAGGLGNGSEIPVYGGYGGGWIAMHAANIISNATGLQIRALGLDGANGSAANSAGGGGGGGGFVRALYRRLAGTLTVTALGGSGGTGVGAGKAGGVGATGIAVAIQV